MGALGQPGCRYAGQCGRRQSGLVAHGGHSSARPGTARVGGPGGRSLPWARRRLHARLASLLGCVALGSLPRHHPHPGPIPVARPQPGEEESRARTQPPGAGPASWRRPGDTAGCPRTGSGQAEEEHDGVPGGRQHPRPRAVPARQRLPAHQWHRHLEEPCRQPLQRLLQLRRWHRPLRAGRWICGEGAWGR